jgi:CDGSH-type Zn-finger protein|tara:strand:+ start:3528 stop:3725 length:198 start_codon:yes stop_codon:yes gene_type:complete
MARVVIKAEKGPVKIETEEGDKWICQCGISKNQPWCDGAHGKTSDEEKGKIYKYHEDGTREEFSE